MFGDPRRASMPAPLHPESRIPSSPTRSVGLATGFTIGDGLALLLDSGSRSWCPSVRGTEKVYGMG